MYVLLFMVYLGLVPAVTCTELWKAGLINQSQTLFQALVVTSLAGDKRAAMERLVPTVVRKAK